MFPSSASQSEAGVRLFSPVNLVIFFCFQKVSLDGFSDGDLDERTLQDSRYDMVEFAKKYFRQGPSGKG